MKKNDFNRIAPYYDWIVKVVFGKSMIEAQTHYLRTIEEGASVLILGGGTGWLLKRIAENNPLCTVLYVDASERMIEISKKNVNDVKGITFLCGTEQEIPKGERFDVVITNFYLDLFTEHRLKDVLAHIQFSLAPKGLWIVTDFVDEGKWWQKFLLRIMYLFFRKVANIEGHCIQSLGPLMNTLGLTEKECRSFYKGFIKTSIYQRGAS